MASGHPPLRNFPRRITRSFACEPTVAVVSSTCLRARRTSITLYKPGEVKFHNGFIKLAWSEQKRGVTLILSGWHDAEESIGLATGAIYLFSSDGQSTKLFNTLMLQLFRVGGKAPGGRDVSDRLNAIRSSTPINRIASAQQPHTGNAHLA